MFSGDTDTFFLDHPLKERYFSFSDDERSGTAAVAARDVRAATAHCPPESEEEWEFFNAAVAEQTIFLLLNPEYLTGVYTRTSSVGSAGESRRFSEQQTILGQRAAALLAPLLAKTDGNVSGSDENSNDENNSTHGEYSPVATVPLRRG